MSIVGTRPPLIGEVSEYELHHRARLAIKPGITDAIPDNWSTQDKGMFYYLYGN